MRARLRTALLLLVLPAVMAGCRESAPLAPKTQVQAALSDLGVYCGEATEIDTFGRSSGRLEQLDSAAAGSAAHLIRIMRADPQATYLGLSMRRVVDGAAKETGECRLTRAATMLSRSLG